MTKRLKLTEELERLLVTHEHAVRLDIELSHASTPVKKEKIRERANTAWNRFHSRLTEFHSRLAELKGAQGDQNI